MRGSDVAKALNVSPETIRQYAVEGRIPFALTPGGHRRYDLDDVKHALRMERPRQLEPLEEGEQESRLSEPEAGAKPIRRAPRPLAMSVSAMIAEAEAGNRRGELSIPFIGTPGSSRFIVGPATRA